MSIDPFGPSPALPVATTTRRKLLARVGATGLATAAMMFGTAGPAAAHRGRHRCCNLAEPAHCSSSFCATHGDYIWRCCDRTACCSCCEFYGSCSALACR